MSEETNSDVRRKVSAETPDWSREKPKKWWDPSRKLIRSIRSYQALQKKKMPWHLVARRVAYIRYLFWSAVTGADIPLSCELGGGLLIPHPNGIVIYPLVKIGPNCLIMQQVTIGTSGAGSSFPEIGGAVDIGAGAKILGGIKLGNYSRIGANSVVLQDVPQDTTAVGIPARLLGKK